MITKQWINKQLQQYPNANPQVLTFIADIRFHNHGQTGTDIITTLFTTGYCYYFAHMLQLAFKRGTICYAHPMDHIVWLDGLSSAQSIAYDINGVYNEYWNLIPETKLKTAVQDFLHIPGRQTAETEFDKVIQNLIDQKEYI